MSHPLPQRPSAADVPQPLTPAAARASELQVAAPSLHGCYLLNYTPDLNGSFITFDGTLRIDASGATPVASGDLYARPFDDDAQLAPPPDPAAGIPVLPRSRYRYYLRVTRFAADGDGLALGFDAFRFVERQEPPLASFDGNLSEWLLEGAYAAQLRPAAPPPGVAPGQPCFEGEVADRAGAAVGRLTALRVSRFLRRATLEIDRVPAAEVPLDNGAGASWRTIFDAVGWDLSVLESDRDVVEPPGGSWNEAEAHAALARRDTPVEALDTEWRYHLLAVRFSSVRNGERGVMYDRGGSAPREGMLVASHWPIPDTPQWGLVRGQRAGATATYFRTAVHELGHALGLDHEEHGTFAMRPTDAIAAEADAAPFPTNIAWAFSPADTHRLRHWPDPAVRPGGLALGRAAQAPEAVASERLRLELAPVGASVPWGAPVRLDVRLVNIGPTPCAAPRALDGGSGAVHGLVVDAAGSARSFGPLLVDDADSALVMLEHGAAVEGALTLLVGTHAMLFPVPGPHRIAVTVGWNDGGQMRFATAECGVVVTPPRDAAHAAAAQRILATPDLLRLLAFGGDHLVDAIEALHAALRDPVLRPHFAGLEARRVATRFGRRPPDFAAAARLLHDGAVMSRAEEDEAHRRYGV